jgi:membrane-associated phospholipid phosphatase
MKNFEHEKFLKWARCHPLTISVGVLLVAALISFLLIDQPLMKYMDDNPTEFHKKPTVNAFRQFGKAWVPIWLLLVWAFVTPWRKAVTTALLSMVIVMPMLLPLKYTFNRLRPEKQLIQLRTPDAVEEIESGSPSFPSGDTATVFAVAAALAAFSPLAVSIPAFLIAAAVGALRVVSMDHFISDVCVGAVIGIVAGYLAARLIERKPDLRIQPPEQFNWKIATYILVIAMPLWVSIFERWNPLSIFLKEFWLYTLLFFLTVVTLNHYFSKEPSQSNNQ